MPKHYFFIIFFLLLIGKNYSQEISVVEEDSHQKFANQLKDSKTSEYEKILKTYDTYINKHPRNVTVRLERCKFIGAAFYDEYEDYNPNWEETDACLELLVAEYPDNAGVLLFQIENTYGEDAQQLILDAIVQFYANESAWTDTQKASLFEKGAYFFRDIDPSKAIKYADIAERTNKEIDLSILVSKIYIQQGNPEKAKEILDINLYYEAEPYLLNQKGNILVELEQFEKAFEIFEKVKEQDSTMLDSEQLYKILIDNNEIEKARTYLVSDTINAWSKSNALHELLKHDLNHGSSVVALQSYKRMQKENFYDDFLGIKQIQILFKNPFQFSYIGLVHIYTLMIFLVLLFLLPFFWISPVYSANKYFKWYYKGKPLWNLKHFWGISFAYLFVQAMVVFLFYYEETINEYFDVATYYYNESGTDMTAPNEFIAYACMMLVATFFFLNKKRLKFVMHSDWSILRVLGTAFGFYLLGLFFLRLYGVFVDISEDGTSIFGLASMKQEIMLLLNEKGILVTVLIIGVLAPIYEEIIFRGIILKSATKYIGHKRANVLQAILFAIVHYFLVLFPFHLVFGLLAGYLSKKSNGLLAPIVFHMMNNTFVTIALYFLSKQLDNLY